LSEAFEFFFEDPGSSVENLFKVCSFGLLQNYGIFFFYKPQFIKKKKIQSYYVHPIAISKMEK